MSASAGGRGDQHRFGSGEPFRIGIEEELLLVDRETHALAHVADRVLPGIELPRERADHEAFLCEIEVRSEPQRSAGRVEVLPGLDSNQNYRLQRAMCYRYTTRE